jgi:hypothetical protein
VSLSSPSSRARGRAARWALACALVAAPAAAAVRLDVNGAVEPSAEGLLVRLEVSNRGDGAAARLDVEGELFGHYAETGLPGGVRGGATESVWLHFPAPAPRPGVHAVALHLRYPEGAAREPVSQRAYLLVAIGARAETPLATSASAAPFETAGTLRVEVRSADGAAHTARVRVLPPRGVNALAQPEVAVPAGGAAVAQVPLIRTGPSRSERHELIVLASTAVEGVETTAVARAMVQLVPHRPWMPRLRLPLAVAGAVLLAGAVAVELWRRWEA